MPDLLVTCPQHLWNEWLHEGDNALSDFPDGAPWKGEDEYHFTVSGRGKPNIEPGERVYIVAYNRLRGYAPLERLQKTPYGGWSLVRRGGAVAVTVPYEIPGFRGFRYRNWSREIEVAFENWQYEGTPWAPFFPYFANR